MRRIAIVHHATLLGDSDAARCLAALRTQVSRDFAEAWGIETALRLAGTPRDDEEALYLLDDAAQADALGLERRSTRPCGFVLLRPAFEAGDPWQRVVSHQLLELLADPLLCLAGEGTWQGRPALFALEVCDPVAQDEYEIDGVPVSNFVLPTWFLRGPTDDALLVDYLGRLADPGTLTPGGHATFCTELGHWQAWFGRRCPRERRQPNAYSRRQRRLGNLPRTAVSA